LAPARFQHHFKPSPASARPILVHNALYNGVVDADSSVGRLDMQSIVIIGAGQAGIQTAESLRKAGFTGDLTLLDHNPNAVFQRPPLSKAFLAGEINEERLRLRPASFFDSPGIQSRLNVRVTRIDRPNQSVHLSDGSSVAYDRLVLATGARPRPIEAYRFLGDRVHLIRDLSDAKRLRDRLSQIQSVAIIGGGFLGLECAATLQKLGKSVTVLEQQPRLLARVSSPAIADYLHQAHTSNGVRIYTNTTISLVTLHPSNEGESIRIALANSSPIDVDELVVAIGVLPNAELAADCGLAVEGGIVTNADGQTADPRIYAVGDVAAFHHSVYQRTVRLESIDNAFEQARSLAQHLLHQKPTVHKIPWFWSDQYQHKLLIAGLSTHGAEWVLKGDPALNSFTVGAFVDNRLQSVECLNQPKDFAKFRKALNNNENISKTAFLEDAI